MGQFIAFVSAYPTSANTMNTNTNKYINRIWSLNRKYARIPGMGNYGIGLEAQRDYYRNLPPLEKGEYENALLMLCQSEEIKKANFALYLCNGLADMFPAEWANRVTVLVRELIDKGLEPAYKNTITYAVLMLIADFNITSWIPFVQAFGERITVNFKQDVLPLGEWELLYNQISRVLIKISPENFWHEFKKFHEDQELLSLLGLETRGVILAWSSFGAFCYGLDWLSRMVTEYSNYPDQTLKDQALLSMEQSFSIVVSQNPTIKQSKERFLEWAKEKLGNR